LTMQVKKHDRFNKWYKKLDLTQKTEVDVRITRIILDSYFGTFKRVGSIFELKFNSGLRVYYAKEGNELIFLLSGGGKNNKSEQSRDIKQAQELYKEYKNGE